MLYVRTYVALATLSKLSYVCYINALLCLYFVCPKFRHGKLAWEKLTKQTKNDVFIDAF